MFNFVDRNIPIADQLDDTGVIVIAPANMVPVHYKPISFEIYPFAKETNPFLLAPPNGK